MPPRPESTARREARQLRAILDAVDRGDVQADSPLAKRMLRRIEGAITALEAKRKGKRSDPEKASRVFGEGVPATMPGGPLVCTPPW